MSRDSNRGITPEQSAEIVRLAGFIRPVYDELDDLSLSITDERLDDLHDRLLNLCRQMDAILHPEIYVSASNQRRALLEASGEL